MGWKKEKKEVPGMRWTLSQVGGAIIMYLITLASLTSYSTGWSCRLAISGQVLWSIAPGSLRSAASVSVSDWRGGHSICDVCVFSD